MGDIQIVQLWVNHVNVGDDMEWDISTEEVLGGSGQATLTVQDRTLSWEPQAHWDVRVVIAASGWVVWRGEILDDGIDFELGLEWRRWKLTCVDYNDQLAQRLVGAFDGKTWIDEFGFGFFVNIDPYNSTLGTDKLTVQTMLDHYFRVDGTALETSTYVFEYITEMAKTEYDYSNLQRAFEDLASMIVQNLQFWIDPDLFFHWVAIPPWQDLLGEGVVLEEEESQSAMMFPEGTIEGLDVAPHAITDIGAAVGDIGFRKLRVRFAGAEMPEQVYVRGGTGYVYNSPPLPPTEETKTVVKSPTAGVSGTYEVTLLETTKLWHTDSTGYVSVSYDSGSPGGPWKCKWVRVPWNEARNKGGNYWKILEGPYTGKLVDDHTNGLSGYGEIVVHRISEGPGDPADPKIGIGGSGWTGEVDQDPNKRQAYLEAPISTTKAIRDQMGGQTLYRGQYPTLRGSVEVTGYDGWRAGQVIQITDARLPSLLNGTFFVIQRVRTELIAETDVRTYTLDFGDGPQSRYSARDRREYDVAWPPPTNSIFVDAHDLTPGPNSTQTITGQLVNGAGEPWHIAGKVVNWSFECYNQLGVLQSGQGSIKPTVSSTDKYGKARTKLTTGPGTDLVYFVFADVIAE